MVSIQFKRPRSSLPINIVKVSAVVLSFVVSGSFLSAIVQIFVGIEGTAGILVTIAGLLPAVVLFMMMEDADFDWQTYREQGDHHVDAVAILVASGVGTGVGYQLSAVAMMSSAIELATICGIITAYEVFVYRNRELFPLHVWPWFGSIYLRVRIDE
jgi:hypothetical protein